MSHDSPARGRLFLVTAPDGESLRAVAGALASRLPRSILVVGSVVDGMVVSNPPDEGASALERTARLLLRWSACLAIAETYQLEGFEAVIADDVRGDHLEDFLDLAAPETVHVLVLDDPSSSTTPAWGLWLDSDLAPDVLADAALQRLDEAKVATAEPSGPSGLPDSR
jgi:hypothetical protein